MALFSLFFFFCASSVGRTLARALRGPLRYSSSARRHAVRLRCHVAAPHPAACGGGASIWEVCARGKNLAQNFGCPGACTGNVCVRALKCACLPAFLHARPPACLACLQLVHTRLQMNVRERKDGSRFIPVHALRLTSTA